MEPGVCELHGVHPVREALRAGRRRLYRLRLRKGGPPRPEIEALRAAARDAGVPVEELLAEAFDAAAPAGVTPQGVMLSAGPLPQVELAELVGGPAPRTVVALDGVEDPQNLGAVARVAEASGAAGLLLTRRRSPPLSPVVSRASAGAIEWLPVARVPNLGRALNWLKDKGFWVFGCEPEAPLELFELPARITRGDRVVLLGAEGRGLRPGVAERVDHHVRIPLAGRVASLNVATAAAVTLFELRRRGG